MKGEAVKFSLGRVVISRNAHDTLEDEDVQKALARHASGDWVDVKKEDWKENEFSLGKHLRLFSVYHADDDTKFWIITEADRSYTTILLPADY